MARIVVRGWAAVFQNDEPVTDPAVLRILDGLVYEDEWFTDYLGKSKAQMVLLNALESGGSLRFGYQEGDEWLTATTEYRSKRPLVESELRQLLKYTSNQWASGIGANWTCESANRCGFTIMCITPGDMVEPNALSIRMIED
ncbi:MAG: hypothetical protein ACLQGP_33915 [Isosphaeraceae bacterium]